MAGTFRVAPPEKPTTPPETEGFFILGAPLDIILIILYDYGIGA